MEYKAMLRQIKDNVTQLDDKTLVDTIFSIGKLHKHQDLIELNKHGDHKFF